MIDPIPAHWEGPRRIAELEARIAAAMSICAEYAYADAPVPIGLLERALTGETK